MGEQRIIDRLDIFLNSKGLNDNKVQKACGIANGTFSQARSGRCDISRRTVEKILATYSELSRVWLLTGEGEMLVQKPTIENTNNVVVGHHNALDHSTVQDGSINAQLLTMLQEQQRQNAELQALLKSALEKIK